jgi:gluconolactonase
MGKATVFADLTAAPGEDALDGMKVDARGDLFVSGPGGVWIFSPEGKQLGMLQVEQQAHNFTFGEADGRTLFLAAHTGLYRIRLEVAGIRPQPGQAR